jgi:hypothetical protein
VFQLAWRKEGRMTTEAPLAGYKAEILFDEILRDGSSYGVCHFQWLRDRLAGWCLSHAKRNSPEEADKWIDRYKAIRLIP